MKLALAFSTPGPISSKDDVRLEYYPEDTLEFGKDHPKFVAKCEKFLSDVVLEKGVRSFSGLTSGKKQFL